MKIIRLTADNMEQSVREAVNFITEGGVVVYPTDTAYGMAVPGLEEDAIARIYRVKGRPLHNPIHLVVKDWMAVSEISELSAGQQRVLERWLPGPVTFVLKRRPVVPASLVGGRDTVGVRIPDHPVTRLLSRYLGVPYTATSANLSGGRTAYSIEDLEGRLPEDIPFLALDYGKLAEGAISSVIDISAWPHYTIIREGVVSKDRFEQFCRE